MVIGSEVSKALRRGRPVVALESTLIAHGLPRPENLEIATEIEEVIRAEGAVPATIVILEGEAYVGVSPAQLEQTAQADLLKASTRDLPWVIANGLSAATTVAGSLWLARRAGIPLLATGGLGGVHREAQQTGDISADLLELSRTPVTVVCSGAKAILDLGRTLESLETLGVPVAGFRTSDFPAFYSRSSGLQLEYSIETPHQAARWMIQMNELGWKGGAVIAQPVPPEDEMEQKELEVLIAKALKTARARQVVGKALTPFLMAVIQQASHGKALAANRSLVMANAALAAQIGRSLQSLSR